MQNRHLSALERERLHYSPAIPYVLRDISRVGFQKQSAPHVDPAIRAFFPHTASQPCYVLASQGEAKRKIKIGVLFSGGPAAGGHNVICALVDAKADVIGFLDGPAGLMKGRFQPIQDISLYRNQGGFDLLGSGRDKIETAEQLEICRQEVEKLQLDGLLIIGGDDSNTNAAILAEYFLAKGCKTSVIGVPKTIDGDLRSQAIEISFGFDSACKTYAEMIGNIARDAVSSKKYYHFIKLMGRSASHVALECAMAVHPNLTLISEEKKSLKTRVGEIASLISERKKRGKSYGVILLPEGLAEDLPQFQEGKKDPHGNISVSEIEIEKWFIEQVKKEVDFNGLGHFLGYEGRCCLPSNFDANYGYALGMLAFLAVREHLTGMICAISNLSLPPEKWNMEMVPIVSLMHLEERKGVKKPVIKKTLVDLHGKWYQSLQKSQETWKWEDAYQAPGPIQFFGPDTLTHLSPITIRK